MHCGAREVRCAQCWTSDARSALL
ncbi:hypothetical protein EN871_30075 [bacterium M00.F.Ca.ET.228.01.1.1]|nr:hypothetical protein EN871_30075 [bacterium M00.F.Ca.ET.228.01.1.1]TGR95999.1 hypothetical protein EN834_29680 [bacterium M00.F.Ca.ET.191.01.1.1]TGT97104.1 hypothetical protein EN798_29690 [bacterium M00.F.Ca.ET.155.01.1.1]